MTPNDSPAAGEDRLLALLLLLPGAVLAWPFAGAPIAEDPYPHLAGSAWIALASLPAALFAAWRGRLAGSPALALFGLVLAAGLASGLIGAGTDTAEARRALVHGLALIVPLAAGSALGAAGRAVLVRGLALLSLAWVAGAFARSELALAGVLGNTGALSQAALPGAVAGLLLAASGRGAWRIGGALAFLAFAVHAGKAPVLAGLLVAGVALALAAALGRGLGRARLVLLAGAALLPLSFAALRLAPESTAPADAASATQVDDRLAADTGGVGVRVAIWKRVPALLAAHPLLGVGPGQMQAAFPPYRDPDEIAASSHGSCEDHATEIDHLHNDVAEGLGELGLAGGVPWLLLLALAAAHALVALRSTAADRAALGAASLALLGNALAHSPLYFHPASAWLGFTLIGALWSDEEPRRGAPWTRALAAAAIAAALLGQPLIVHGRELTASLQGRARTLAAAQGSDAAEARDAALEWERFKRALDALPGSVPALFLELEWYRTMGAEGAGEALERILARRPNDLRALQTRALLAAQAGDVGTAREHWGRALALDPGHPKVLRNLARLEAEAGESDAAATHVAALEALGCLDPAWLEELAVALLRAARGTQAFALLERVDERFGEAYGGLANALAAETRQAGKADLADGLESAAHHLWAREHAASGDYRGAVRSYRQAVRPIHAATGGGPTLLALELGAAQILSGDPDGAERTLAGVELLAADLRHLPGWARDALRGAGYTP
ncbi:MAG: O-antigen ligase family protein [Planctomycetota bacterium]